MNKYRGTLNAQGRSFVVLGSNCPDWYRPGMAGCSFPSLVLSLGQYKNGSSDLWDNMINDRSLPMETNKEIAEHDRSAM